MLNIVRSFLKAANTRSLASLPPAASSLNRQHGQELVLPSRFVEPREVWIENLDTEEEKMLGILNLHPKIFSATPRMDIIHVNFEWQKKYRYVSFAHAKLRMECNGGGR